MGGLDHKPRHTGRHRQQCEAVRCHRGPQRTSHPECGSSDLDLSGTNGVTCSYAKDITFRNVRIAAEKNPYTEDHSQNVRRIGWNEVTLLPAAR